MNKFIFLSLSLLSLNLNENEPDWPGATGDIATVVIFLNAEPARTFRLSIVPPVSAGFCDGFELFAIAAEGKMLRSIDGCRDPLRRLAARAYRSTDESRLGGRL